MSDVTRTLIVEDEEHIRFFLRETLQREGHAVTEAASGEEALQIVQERGFDVAILDLVLGGEVDGQDVLEAIRARWPETVAIVMTAHGSVGSAVEALRGGVDDYVLKPVRAAEVRRVVREALERRQAPEADVERGASQPAPRADDDVR